MGNLPLFVICPLKMENGKRVNSLIMFRNILKQHFGIISITITSRESLTGAIFPLSTKLGEKTIHVSNYINKQFQANTLTLLIILLNIIIHTN